MSRRFIVRFRGKGPRPTAATRDVPSFKVIDDTSRMMLIEGAEEEIRNTFAAEEWLVTPEISVDNPVDRPRAEKKPED